MEQASWIEDVLICSFYAWRRYIFGPELHQKIAFLLGHSVFGFVIDQAMEQGSLYQVLGDRVGIAN